MTTPPRIAPPPFPDLPRQEPEVGRPMPVGRAVLLALLLGPIGLGFISIPAALFTGFVAIVVGVGTVGAGLVPVFIFCGIIAFVIAPREPKTP